MNFLMELIAYLKEHGPAIAAIVLALLSVAEMIVRLTPTTKDDGAVERVGLWIRKVLDFLKVPNLKKGSDNK